VLDFWSAEGGEGLIHGVVVGNYRILQLQGTNYRRGQVPLGSTRISGVLGIKICVDFSSFGIKICVESV